jgi:hypothetical protein
MDITSDGKRETIGWQKGDFDAIFAVLQDQNEKHL